MARIKNSISISLHKNVGIFLAVYMQLGVIFSSVRPSCGGQVTGIAGLTGLLDSSGGQGSR